MKALDKYKEEDIIFFDIETASAVKRLKKGSPLEAAWLYKFRHQNEVLKKTGEPSTPEEYWAEKSALYAPFGQVVSVVAGRISGEQLKVKVYSGKESDLLTDFNNDLGLVVTPMTVLCGWQSIGFDQPFLTKRMIVNSIAPHDILDNGDLKPWQIPAIDLAQLWKGSSFYPDSLISVAVALGLPSPKDALEGSEVSEAFWAGRIDEINTYCTKDVLTTANIFRKFQNKPLLTLAQ